MQHILVVTNTMPLCFRNSRAKEDAATLTYISGTSVLGGLAAAHQRLGRPASEFAQFFLSQQVQFSNLYPANFSHDDLTDDTLPVMPLPLTARSCKRFSGFHFNAQQEDEERHGVVDHLIPWAVFALSEQRAIRILEDHRACCQHSECELELDRFSEKFYRQGEDTKAWGCSSISHRLLTRSGVNRQRGAVQEGILYNREVLAEGQIFWGTVESGNAALLQQVSDFIRQTSTQELLYLGNNKSRGLGKVSVTVEQPSVEPDTTETLAERVQTFTESLKTISSKYGVTPVHDLYIPVTLHSDVILRDALLRYQSALLPAVFPFQGITPVYQTTDQRRIIGWSRFLGLPKPGQWAITMGSVFLFGYSGQTDATFWQQLLQVQTDGIGERRSEGFGRIKIADPFHTMEEQPR